MLFAVCVDGSASSRNAFNRALEYLKDNHDNNDQLDLLTVAEEAADAFIEDVSWVVDTNIERKQAAERLLADYAAICNTYQIKHQLVLKIGDVRDELVQQINSKPYDTVFVGSRGLSTLARVLLGSVSNYLVENAQCPVFVVKLPVLPTKPTSPLE